MVRSQSTDPNGNTSTSQPAFPFPIMPMGTALKQVMPGSNSTGHAFAGHGIPTKHYSWLLPSRGEVAGNMLSAVAEMLRQRNLGFQVRTENLCEPSFQQVEERYYLIVQRKVGTVFIYIAPAGDDLYISRSTSVHCPFSMVRIIWLILMILVVFLWPSILSTVIATSSGNPAIAVSFGLVLGVVYTVSLVMLLWFLIRSFGYWLREKDFWVYLRSLILKDFEIDDIMLLEHATDITIRAALEQLGEDASYIIAPPQGYQQERRIRLL